MKISKYLMMLAAAVGMTAACQKDELIKFDPVTVVAPVLEQVSDIVVTEDNMATDKVKFVWSKADFGMNVLVTYTLVTVYGEEVVELNKDLSGTEVEVAYSTLNGKFYNDLGMPAGVPTEVKFMVYAKLADSDKVYSNEVKINFTAVEAEKTYPVSIYGVVGTINGWAAPDVKMFDIGDGMYAAFNVVFDQGENWFKIRANEVWEESGNFGLSAKSAISVDAGYDLISGNGSQDIGIADGKYDVWFDLTNMKVYAMTPGKHPTDAGEGEVVVPVDPSTLSWYLVGQFNSWATQDAAYKLTNSDDGKWFTFKNFTSDGEGFKLVAGETPEDGWSVANRGAEGDVEPYVLTAGAAVAVVEGGKNFSIAAGTYDVYMNAACDKVYVTVAGEVPEEVLVKYTEYIYVPGNHQTWAPATAPALWSPEKNGVYTGFCNFNGDFKFTHARDWNNGEYNSTNFETYADGFSASTDGTNITAPAGYYFVTVKVPEKKLEATSVVWGVIGSATAGGWDADQDMIWDAAKACWTATVELTAGGEWKFRANDDWTINLGGSIENLVADGGNITVTEGGTYVIDLYTERTATDKIYCTVTKQ